MNNDDEEEEEKICSICGDELEKEYPIKLKCNHQFHYECILLTFKNFKNLECPYCRNTSDYLPIVNGLKKAIPNIHYNFAYDEKPKLENKKCNSILKRGKNKGNECGRNCKLGYYQCRIHFNK
tara:strand:+ start:624 stop:992 length:369 start_codon:yes stop_codon:yes gene_type:complete